MKYDRLWERLLQYINQWASAEEVDCGIRVTFEQHPGTIRTVDLVITPSDWDDYISTIYGTGDPSSTNLKRTVFAIPDEFTYLVYDTYDWVPSSEPVLPDDDIDPGPGVWVVTDANGRVLDSLTSPEMD